MKLASFQLVEAAGRGFCGEDQEFSFRQVEIETSSVRWTMVQFGREIKAKATKLGIEAT